VRACVFWCWCRCCCFCCKLLKPKALHHLELSTWQNEDPLSMSPPPSCPLPSKANHHPKFFPFLLFFLILSFLCFAFLPSPRLLYTFSVSLKSHPDRLVFHPRSLSFFSFPFFSHYSRHQMLAAAVLAVNLLLLLFFKFFYY
jgi:hypothetical protein